MSYPDTASYPVSAHYPASASYPAGTNFPGIWTPAQISGLSVFLRQQSGFVTAPGNAITACAAQFGTSNGATANGVSPTLTGTGAQFDQAGDDTLTLGTPLVLGGQPFTVYCVGTLATAVVWAPIGSSSTTSVIYSDTIQIQAQDDNGNQLVGSFTTAPSGLIIVRLDYDGTTATLTWTGNTVGVAATGMGPFTLDSIGNWPNGGAPDGSPSNRQLATIVVYGRDIVGTSDETKLLAWIASNLNGASFIDTDAANVIAAITSAGVTPSSGQQSAINNFVSSGKGYGLWPNLSHIYGYVGGTAATHAIDWKNPSGTAVTWHGGITHNANGVIGDGSTGYGDTGIAATALTRTNSGLSVFLQTNTSGSLATDIGATDGSTKLFYFQQTASTGFAQALDTLAASIITTASAISTGFYTLARSGNTNFKLFYNGSQIGTSSVTDAAGALPGQDIGLLAAIGPSGGTAFSARQQSIAIIHTGIVSTQGNLNTIVHALQAALGRTIT